MNKKQKLEAEERQQLSAKDKELFELISKCKVLHEELKELVKEQEKRWKI